jgi:hypothetical protein
MTDQSITCLIFAAPFMALALIFAVYETARIAAAIKGGRS